uniref:NADH-ubiquinone oxidoreductase chain 4 n=1 Tax=Coccinellidae sp. 1 EF-2015 TaxID=1756852 RepID=A0A0S2M721_9CUCU|nr:NADH deshydrogenase subunit 4 [Coccinellidae sp. 1 EF-2015]
MMKLILFMIFMIPLCFLKFYWLLQSLILVIMMLFMFKFSFLYFSEISYFMGFDILSYFMILLSFWISFLMYLASEKLFKNKNFYKLFSFMVLLLMISLVMVFSMMNIFMFYLFFEFSLIPILIIIMGWGYQPERIQAGVYLFFYTMMASLPMMLFIFYLYNNNFSLDFFFMKNIDLMILYFMVNMVFFVKMPMFIVHLWLPKAHVEAPVAGSMILAGVMLKLGGYGLMRFMVIFMEVGMKLNLFFMNLSLLGAFLISLVCIRQSDMKSLIAYSSVVHMGLMLSGFLTLKVWSFSGSLLMMLAHGLCSSGLFVLVNINYERFYSRNLYINKGMLNLMPSLSIFWFFLVIANMAAPPSMNLLGEIFLINSLVGFSSLNMFFIMLISFFSAVYSLYLYSFSQHGKFSLSLMSFMNISIREYLLLLMHLIPLNIFILKSGIFILYLSSL